MQVVRTIINCKLILFTVQLKRTSGNPIGHAATDGTEVGMFGEIPVERVEPEHDVNCLTTHNRARKRHRKACENRTVVSNCGLPSTGHLQCVQAHRPSIGQLSKWRFLWRLERA